MAGFLIEYGPIVFLIIPGCIIFMLYQIMAYNARVLESRDSKSWGVTKPLSFKKKEILNSMPPMPLLGQTVYTYRQPEYQRDDIEEFIEFCNRKKF